MADLEQIYQYSAPARVLNGLVGAAVAAVVKTVAPGRVLRVLEVGAGTGATSASVLPMLRPDATRYVYTDVSRVFLDRAAEKFGAFPFIEYRTLDLERDPQAQDFAPQQFDLVIAVNVIHATSDLRRTLGRLQTLLAPGGIILFGEATVARRWLDLTFGLTDGWWKFEDRDLRGDHALIGRAGWTDLLAAMRCREIAALPAVRSGVPESQTLFIARFDSAPAPAAAGSRRWLILADDSPLGDRVASLLHARGFETLVVRRLGAGDEWPADRRIDPEDAGAFDALVASSGDRGPWLGGCLNLWHLDAPSVDRLNHVVASQAWAPGCLGSLHVVQSLARAGLKAPLWTVTRHAFATSSKGAARNVIQATAWGLGRVIALEHPDLWGGLIDIDETDPSDAAARLVAEMFEPDGEDQIAWRDGHRLVPRLIRAGRVAATAVAIDPDATYLITGGLGNLGLKLGLWLAANGARHVTLVGRSALPPREQWPQVPADSAAGERIAGVRAIERAGAIVRLVAGDVADFETMSQLFAEFGSGLPVLRGIVHAAHDTEYGSRGRDDGRRHAADAAPEGHRDDRPR